MVGIRSRTNKYFGSKRRSATAATNRKRNSTADQMLAFIVESSHDAIVSKDLDGIVTSWNQGAERLLGYKASEIVGRPLSILIPLDRREEDDKVFERLRRGELVEPYETVRTRKDGTTVDVLLTASPIRDATGQVIGVSKIARDITQRKRADELRELFIAEMRHRAANLAAVINAIASQSRPKHSPVVDAYIERFTGRLQTILSAGDLIIASSSRTPDLAEILRTAISPFAVALPTSRITLSGPSLAVSEPLAGGLALAVHELATNALKYGALSNEEGTVELTWNVTPEVEGARVVIEWRERGGPAVSPPQRTGFGSRVINSAVRSAEDSSITCEYERDGLRCQFSFRT